MPEISETTSGSVPTAAVSGTAASAASGAAATTTEPASGAAKAVSGTASGQPNYSSAGTASGSVPGVTKARDSTIRRAERLAEEDPEAHKFVRLADEDEAISTLWGSTKLSKVGEITDVAVTVPMERNELDYSNPDPEQCYSLVDEYNGQPLDAQNVAEGVR
eukprot:1880067-Amphidinium_carterae.2